MIVSCLLVVDSVVVEVVLASVVGNSVVRD